MYAFELAVHTVKNSDNLRIEYEKYVLKKLLLFKFKMKLYETYFKLNKINFKLYKPNRIM